MANKKDNWLQWIVPEAAFFAFLYYVQFLLKVGENLWLSTLVLWVLLNVAIVFCPVLRKCRK